MLWIKAKHVHSDIQMDSYDRVLRKKTAQVAFQLLMLKRDVQVGKFYVFNIKIYILSCLGIQISQLHHHYNAWYGEMSWINCENIADRKNTW